VLGARPAQAANLTGAVQLSLDGSLVSYSTLKTTTKPSDAPSGIGVPDPSVETNQSSTTLGVLNSGLGIGFGYSATNNLLVGVRTQFEGDGVAFLPRLEIIFDGDRARPFLAGMVGVASASQTTEAPTGEKDETSATKYLAGASLGVHAFLTDTVSIDPMLTLEGFSGSGTSKHTAGNLSTDDMDSSTDVSVSGVSVLFTVGFSAWLGGHASAPSVLAPVTGAAAADGAGEADDEADDSPAGAMAEQADPNWVEIDLPKQRRLYLQKTQHPERRSASVRFAEPRAQWALVGCAQISVPDGGGPQELHETGRVENGEQHSVSGKLPLRALTLLATSAARIRVCNKEWPVSDKSRRAIQEYLDGRATNRPSSDEDLGAPAKPAETAPAGATAPPSDATPTPAPAPVPTPAP